MTIRQNIETVAHEQRGKDAQRYSESGDGQPRALYSFAALLIGSIGGLIKQLAYPNRSEPWRDQETEDVVTRNATDPGRGEDNNPAASDGFAMPERAAEQGMTPQSGRSSGTLRRDHMPVSYTPNTTAPHDPQQPRSTSAQAAANDNLTLRLPLSPVASANPSNSPGASGNSGVVPSTAAGSDDPSSAPTGPPATDGKPPAGNAGSATSDRNRAPVASGPVNLGQLYVNASMVIALTDLLQRVSDPDGDTLRVDAISASSGSVSANADSSWTFTPDANDDSAVSFSYTVSDGRAEIAQTAELDLVNRPDDWMLGTPGDDVMVGTEQSDAIAALGGSDIVAANGGDDEIDGGDGNDIITGGSGNDFIRAGAGNDIVDGGAGNDIILAGSGNDIAFGGDGDDVIAGEAGDDVIEAGTGQDVVDAGSGNDVVRATGSGAGSVPSQSDGDDTYDGGDGVDTYDLSATTSVAKIDLGTGRASSVETGSDTLLNIENVIAGSSSDEIAGGDGANRVAAGGGADRVALGAGDDTAVATIDDGNDVIDGGAGVDTYDLSRTTADATVDLKLETASSDQIGTDTITNIENVVGGTGNDRFIADEDQNVFVGGAGADEFVFASAEDSSAAESERDRIDDFEVGDKIDVSRFDADEVSDGEQRFSFRGESDRFEKAGELRYMREKRDDGDHTMVFGNTDDDLDEDYVLDLVGSINLTSDDFIGLA